jgi:hypothetical protein
MSDFSIPEGRNTPAVSYTSNPGVLTISGRSYPEDARKFYDNIFHKMPSLVPYKHFTFELNFEYISSASVVCILELLKTFKSASPKTEFTIRFFYESGDSDMMEIGENYQKLSGMKIEYLVK